MLDGCHVYFVGIDFYTAVNIPYGSMASAISAEAKDRAQLSTWRTVGATLAGLVIGAGTPMLAYVTVEGQTVLSGFRMTVIAGVFSVLSFLCYLLCVRLTAERVEVRRVKGKPVHKPVKKSNEKPGIAWHYCGGDVFAACLTWHAGNFCLCISGSV